MKKNFLALAVLLITGLTSAFANKVEGNKRAVESFGREFANAQNVSWVEQKDYSKATFSLYNHIMFAYYDKEGQLLAVVRNLLSDQLPLRLLTEMKKKYSGYWISDLFEVDSEDQTSYYLTLENADEKIVLRSDGIEHWSVYKKEKKNTVDL